jgi:hypothetical protein
MYTPGLELRAPLIGDGARLEMVGLKEQSCTYNKGFAMINQAIIWHATYTNNSDDMAKRVAATTCGDIYLSFLMFCLMVILVLFTQNTITMQTNVDGLARFFIYFYVTKYWFGG